jgi:hypothetical protein
VIKSVPIRLTYNAKNALAKGISIGVLTVFAYIGIVVSLLLALLLLQQLKQHLEVPYQLL